MQEPPSPGTARKRTNEEVYEKPQRPTTIASTTPLKSPPGVSFQERARPDPRRASQSRFEEIGFASLQAARAEKMPTSTAENAPMPDGSEKEQKPGPNTFVQDIAAYQQCLEAKFQDYENELKSRDRSQELAALDWQDLEERYQKEIGPKIAEEQEIMNEFQARFGVGIFAARPGMRLTSDSNSCSGCKCLVRGRARERAKGEPSAHLN